MADRKSSANSVSSLESIDENYENKFYQLLDVYNELHEEARKLQYSNNRHKGENMWLENKLKQLEIENEELKIDLENMEKSQNCNCKKNVINCENCPKQLEMIKYLMSTLTRFTLRRNNLNAIIGSQWSVSNREGIGYVEHANILSNRLGSQWSVLYAFIIVNLPMHQINVISRNMVFLKVNINGYLRSQMFCLTWKDPNSIG